MTDLTTFFSLEPAGGCTPPDVDGLPFDGSIFFDFQFGLFHPSIFIPSQIFMLLVHPLIMMTKGLSSRKHFDIGPNRSCFCIDKKMTDFINDAYGNRCFDHFRELKKAEREYRLKDQTVPVNHPLLLKFHTCLYRPFLNKDVHQKLKQSLDGCLVESNQDYTKCIPQINELRRIGGMEAQENVYFDVYSTVKTQNAINQCKENVNKAKEYSCDAFPERHECVEVKEKAFACIARASCSELYHMSGDCFRENEQMESDSLWKYIFKGQDVQTKKAFEKHCSNIQSDLIRCFDKYFLLSQVIRQAPQQGLDEENFNFYGPITPEEVKKRQKVLEQRLKQEKEQERRYKEQ